MSENEIVEEVGIDYIDVDNTPVDPDAGDYDDDVEGEANGKPVVSVYGSEREAGIE